MVGLWDKPGIPHRGWRCVDVYDLREDGSTPEETNYATCEMCGHERIRFVHVLQHNEYENKIRVGCICAEKLTNNYINPKAKETNLAKKAARKSKWLSRRWKTSKKGNPYLNIEGHNLTVFPNKFKPGFWKYQIDGQFSKDSYPTSEQAKMALFEEFWGIISEE
ncbi:MAG: hypothetical protein JW749_12705 [Sedimentisphaerales bacterium]|nr:hypothetical protein [Sedimentisphaerales bacterium]